MHRFMKAAAVLLLIVGAACQSEDNAPPTTSNPSRDEQQEETPEEIPLGTLIYSEGRTLKSFDLETGDRKRIARLPSREVALSPDGSRYVTVRKRPTASGNPVVVIGSIDGGKPKKLGPGHSPRWSPDGSRIAVVAIAPKAYLCEQGGQISPRKVGPGCTPAEFIYTYDPEQSGGIPEGIGSGPAKNWRLLGWTRGDSVLASSGKNTAIIPVDPEGERTELAFRPNEIAGASPTENLLITVHGRRVRMGAPGEEAMERVDLGRAVPIAADWSPDGSTIAILTAPNGGRGGNRKVVIVEAESRAVAEVPDSEGAQRSIAWLPGGEALVYSRPAPDNPRRLEAVRCTVELECEPLFLHKPGATMLAIRQ